MVKAKKGDYCAITKRHSYTSLKEGTHSTWSWYLGRVTKASRDGIIKSATCFDSNTFGVLFEMQEHEYDRDRWWKALSIGAEYQAIAAELAKAGTEFASADALRAAFRERAA